jgi:hypothetical protein
MKNNNFASVNSCLAAKIMKKVYSLSALFTCVAILSSCNSDPENHLLNIVYPAPYKVLYADEVGDSVIFETFDSYKMKSQADWIAVVGDDSYNVTYDYRNIYAFSTKLQFSPNTTGKTRSGSVRIDSYEYSTAALFYQLGFLNITHPTPVFPESEQSIPESASFELTVDASAVADSICFNVNHPWRLKDPLKDGIWASLDRTSGDSGHQNVTLTLTPNTDTDNSRTVTFELLCGGVSNMITVKQLPALKNTEE